MVITGLVITYLYGTRGMAPGLGAGEELYIDADLWTLDSQKLTDESMIDCILCHVVI